MTLKEAIEFAESCAEAAFDCWRDDYATLQDAIDSHCDNVRDTLNDEHAAHFEHEAFAAFDKRVELLRLHAAEDALIAERRAALDYGVTMRECSAPFRTVTLCINGATVFELTRSGYSVSAARQAAEDDAFARAIADGEINADAVTV